MFITLEGPEGAGKSTLQKSLALALEDQGTSVFSTREPGGSGDVGASIRQVLLHGGALTPLTEVFLFLADRAQHVQGFIAPALREGKTVLCDRYADSTLVYQGYGRGLDLESLRHWNDEATDGLTPDLTLLLDIDPAIGLQRSLKGDRLDQEPLEFHQKVRAGFLAEASREPARWRILDASQSPETVLAEALSAIR